MSEPKLLRVHAVLLASAMALSSPLSAAAAEWLYDRQVPAAGDPAHGSPEVTAADAPLDATTDILEAAVAESPGDAASRLRLAEAYAAGDAPAKALESCREAARIDPDNASIRRLCAHYAEWAGDLPESRRQFRALLELVPDDKEGLLGAARAHGWSGKLEQAAGYYHRFLRLYPDNPDAWIQYARIRSWQGDFASALNALDDYRQRFGYTSLYREEKARYLAWDNRPREALALIDPLVDEQPDDYDRLYTRTIALAADRQTGEALGSLKKLNRIRPDSADTALLNRVVRTPIRSSVGARASYYEDSDTIEIRAVEASAEIHVTNDLSLSAGADHHSVRADRDSGFATIDGRDRIHYEQTRIGGSYRFNPLAAITGHVGHGDIQDAGSFTPYEIALELRPADSTTLSLRRGRDLHAPSPRAASLAILRDHNELSVSWRPDYRYVVEAIARHDDYSDGNRKRQLIIAPRRSVLRTWNFNADLGLYMDWLSFDDDVDNGYYDPERYQRYATSFFGYWKINEDHGLSLIATAGFHEDDRMDKFEFGTDIAVELTSGLYNDWKSVFRIDHSDRFEGAGGFDGWKASLGVTRRF